MIDIRNQAGDRLLLSSDTSLVLEQAAGLLDADSLPGGFSYPLSFPLTDCPPNQRFVGQTHRPAASGAMELPVQLLVDGGLYRNGVLRYKIENGLGSGTLRLDYSAQTDELAGRKLAEVLTDPVYLGATNPGQMAPRMGQIAQLPIGSFPLTFFPLRNEGFMDEEFTAQRIAQLPGLTYERPVYVNAVNADGVFQTDTLTGKVGQPVVPFFFLTWVVGQLLGKFGYRMAGGWPADGNVQRLVVLNMTAIRSSLRSGVAPDGSNQISQYWAMPGLHLPESTVAEFLKSVRERYGLFFRWDSRGRVCYVDRFSDLLLAPAVDLRGALQIKGGGVTDAARTGYSVYEYVEGTDELRRTAEGQAQLIPPVIYGDGKTEVKLRVGTCSMVREIRPGSTASWTLPALRCPGNVTEPLLEKSDRYLSAEGTRKNSIGLLVLSYVPLSRDSSGRFYPSATPFPVDGESVTLGGKRGGWLSGLRSVFSFRAKTKGLTQQLLLPVAQAASLLPGSRLHLRDPQGNEATGLLDLIQAELPAQRGLVKCRLVSRLLPPIGENPAPAIPPIVYVELSQVERIPPNEVIMYPTTQYPAGISCSLSRRLLTLTVRAWADAGRTIPAVFSQELLLTLRVSEHNSPDFEQTATLANPDPLYTIKLPISQAVQVVDAQFENYATITIRVSGRLLVGRTRTIQLEVGEGYQLL
ncbi:hypothetical protein [Fibrivirga algicola]|uniref:Tip attachment protein J domain-containing protein n=1 Tax=Fibrivirga algicola TaxID=2950420 RepID=A0ABX0QS22_9BACT|nr:hypothetical protein [Fibrivirga algicola]NID13792.1 hypothetical protein [Fibrivirga algicola]